MSQLKKLFLLDRRDTSGIQFFIGNELRQYDIGYLTFGTDASIYALAIPPGVDRFAIDSYCPVNASLVSIIPLNDELKRNNSQSTKLAFSLAFS